MKIREIANHTLWIIGWPLWLFAIFLVWAALKFTDYPNDFANVYAFLKSITLGIDPYENY